MPRCGVYREETRWGIPAWFCLRWRSKQSHCMSKAKSKSLPHGVCVGAVCSLEPIFSNSM